MNIDWEGRYKLMRLHFVAELVLELVYNHLNPIEKIGAYISQDKARIHFKWEKNISKTFPVIQKEALKIIVANQDISSAFSDKEEGIGKLRDLHGFPVEELI